MAQFTLSEIIANHFEDDFLAFSAFLEGLMPLSYRKRRPPWLHIFEKCIALEIAKEFGGAISTNEIADGILLIGLDYWRGRFFEDLIKEQTEQPCPICNAKKECDHKLALYPQKIQHILRKRGSLRDNTPEKIAEKKAKGQPLIYNKRNQMIADAGLVVSCDRLLTRMKAGSNEVWGWRNYYKQVRSETRPRKNVKDQDSRDVRRASTGQKFAERILQIVDPERTDLPKPGFYWDMQQRYDLHSA